MTKEKMNIHKALCELKTLDSRIEDKIADFEPVAANRESNRKINGKSVEDFKHKADDDYKSITDLINRRYALKKAVVNSNARTTVEIGGSTYTIAEAIEMKNSGLSLLVDLRDKILRNYSLCERKCNDENVELSDKADTYVANVYNGGDKNIKNNDLEAFRRQYIEQNTWSIIEGIRCKEEIEKLDNTITSFIQDVDAALSVSNAITEIEFEY